MGEVRIGELRARDQQGAVADLVCGEDERAGTERRDRDKRSHKDREPESRERHGLMIPISPPPGVSSRYCEYDSRPVLPAALPASRMRLELNADSTTWPSALGYRMPAEWEPHEATWLSWPHNRDSWPGVFEGVEPAMAAFVAALAECERVHINV